MTDCFLAIDPGGTTGCAIYRHGSMVSCEQSDFFILCTWLNDNVFDFEAVICEQYTITARTARLSQQHDALHIIGVLRYLCRRDGIPLVFQAPSAAKAFSTNAKLKEMGWYKGGAGHADDASRHLLVYMAKNNLLTHEQLDRLAAA